MTYHYKNKTITLDNAIINRYIEMNGDFSDRDVRIFLRREKLSDETTLTDETLSEIVTRWMKKELSFCDVKA